MYKITKILAFAFIIATLLSLLSCASAVDVTASSPSASTVVRASSNDGVEFDIKGYKSEGKIYLFMPADVNLAKLFVTFGNETKLLDMTYEKTVKLSDGTYTLVAMQTNLPVLYMQIDETKGTINAMNRDGAHKTKCYGTFYLDVPKKLAAEKGWADFYTDTEAELKGRGNATWGLDKKGYRIKLGKKQSVLEMGKDKTWILLANHGDRSLIRNKLAYDFAKDMGLEFSVDSEFIDVYFNGEYQGNYLLTEKVEVGKQRVNIYDLEDKDENPDADRLTGGYLIEYDRLAQSEKTWFTGKNTGRLISVKSPEEATAEQKNYISTLVNNMEDAIYSADGKSTEGKHYSEYMDVDSFIKLYWINEIFKNGDFFYGSTFMYKDVGADEKLYSGPAWDFDITLGNACSNAGAETPSRQANLASPSGWWARTVADGFTKYLFNHEDFCLRNKEVYDEVVRELMLNLPQKAQEYADYIKKSADMNFVRWDVLEKDHQWKTPNTATTYGGEVEYVKNYLTERGKWVDETMNGAMAASNLGTELNPIKITSADDLRKLADEVNAGESYTNYYFLQTVDIDLENKEFTPIGVDGDGFCGNYDGGGHKITNLKITAATVNNNMLSAGLFGRVGEGGGICNVNIESGTIDVVAREAGGVVAYINGAKVYNCVNKASVTNRASTNLQIAGGIVGNAVSSSQNYIVNCINLGTVSAPSALRDSCSGVGGIVGNISGGNVVGCVNVGGVSAPFPTSDGEVPMGGIVGKMAGNRIRVSYVYWLGGEGGVESGVGRKIQTSGKPGRDMSSFSGMALSGEEAVSEKFVYEMNKMLVDIANTAGMSYKNLKMWETHDGELCLTTEYATMEKLPKYEPEWIMSKRDTAFRWIWKTSGAEASFEDDTLVIKPNTRDPITLISLAENERFSADEYRYAAMKMKVVSEIDYGGFFFGTDQFPGPVAECYSQFDVINDGKWHEYIIDMSSYEHDRWHGSVYTFRVDPINSEDTNAVISIERIGLFKTEAEAKAFLDDSPKMNAIVTDSVQTVYLSENALKTRGDKTKYMLSDNTVVGEKLNENAQTVVMYIDNGGNESVLPICYIDENMYSRYVANKPGTYKLTYGYKAYNDTASHWGAEYIDFVSARGLFGGTSPTEFSPDEAMTRGMFITVLGRMHGVDTTEYDGKSTGFDDVNKNEYYAPYVQWAAKNGIVNSMADRNFYPDVPVSRQDMAMMIYNYLTRYSYSLEQISEEISFTDISSLSSDYATAVKNIQRCGIINGKENNKFDPNGFSTRAEVSTVMTRMIKAILGVL